jgi:4'-phosphopantetheinyl transferase
MSLLLLTPGEIHVWILPIAELLPIDPHAVNSLSADELARGMRFRLEKHQAFFFLTRILLRKIIARYLSIIASDIEYVIQKKGKPALTNTDLQFNLSHSGDLAVVALTRQAEIGIDIEEKKMTDYLSIAKRFFSADEYNAIAQLSNAEGREAFYQIWTRKEALVKAVGEGISMGFNQFTVPADPVIQLTNYAFLKKSAWYLATIHIHPGFAASIATCQKVTSTTYFTVDQEFFCS